VPVREVALRVLRASRDVGVKRAVLTSSFAGIGYGLKPGERRSTRRIGRAHAGDGVTACVKSKALVEFAAWDFIALEAGGLELSVARSRCLPGWTPRSNEKSIWRRKMVRWPRSEADSYAVSTGGTDAGLEAVMEEQEQTNKQTKVDVRKWLTDISEHCPECGSSNLTTVKNERPLKHTCLDCLIFFAERDLKEKP